MKKVLFASTALVAGALAAPQFASAQSVSASNADITFGGYARFGLLYVDAPGASSTTDITHRWRLQIDTTAESDAGVEFGARVRISQDAGGVNKGINGARFHASAGGLTVRVGNILGVLEGLPGMYPVDIGLTGHSYEYAPYLGGGGDGYSSGGLGASGANGVEVVYSAGDLTLHASASDTNDRRAVSAAYTFSGWTAALAVQDSDAATDTEMAFTIGGDIGPAFINLAFADNGTNGDRVVLAGRFDVGASTNVEAYILDDDAGEGWGLDFNHNMGGGTSLRGGISETIGGTTLADLGVRFNF